MRIAFVGIGGVGGYYGGMVARAAELSGGADVFFIARGDHLAAIREKGLRVVATDGEYTARPLVATDRPEEIGVTDVVVFAVKGYALEKAAREAIPLVRRNTAVLPLLNGVNSTEVLSAILPSCRMLNGCVYLSAHRDGPGVVRQTGGSRKLFFGPVSGEKGDFSSLERFFRGCGIDATLEDPIDTAVWTKFLFMSPMAGTTSLLGKTFGEVLSDSESLALTEGMMRELQALAVRKDVPLPEDVVEQSIAKARAFSPGTKSSMQRDCERGEATEIETFLGYVVAEGDRLGVDVHLTRGVYDALKLRMIQPCASEQEAQRP